MSSESSSSSSLSSSEEKKSNRKPRHLPFRVEEFGKNKKYDEELEELIISPQSAQERKVHEWLFGRLSRSKRGLKNHVTTEPPQNATLKPDASTETGTAEEDEEETGSVGGDDDDGDEKPSKESEESEADPHPSRKRGKKRRRPRREVDAIVIPDSVGQKPFQATSCDLSGFWYNNKGSEVLLRQTEDGNLTGEYRTGVERECGTAGTSHSKVRGSVHGNLVTFHALFKGTNGGRSVATWVGQCHRDCNFGFFSTRGTDQVVLHTTWVLSTEEDTCDEHWGQNRVGQDIFVRKPLAVTGPRKAEDHHTPARAR
jgi:hypothetical protein